MAQSFTAQIEERVRAYERRLIATAHGSAQELAETAKKTIPQGGNLPHDTGNLRRSLMASTASMPTMSSNGNQEFADNAAQIEAVIMGWELSTPLFLGWGAAYARRMEYGFQGTDSLGRTYNQQGFGFTRLAAQQWQQIVSRNAQRSIQAFP